MTKQFLTFFPLYKDFHFFKDPGQIPYRFKLKGWNSKILRFQSNSKCKITKDYITIDEIPIKTCGFGQFSVWKYMCKNAYSIDVLNLFQISFGSLFAAFIYKLYNKNGFVYLKLDNYYMGCPYDWEKIWIGGSSITLTKKLLIKYVFINKIDLFSIEDNNSLLYFENKYPFLRNKIICVYNGHTVDLFNNINVLDFNHKENIIFTASNLGTYMKATNILLYAFAKTSANHNWKMILAGSIAEDFRNTIDNFFDEYPLLKERVIFTGLLNKTELFDLYNRSKIFCMPSRNETFANVFAEAMYFRNAIITTPTTSLKYLIDKYKIGTLVNVNDENHLSKRLIELINNPKLTEELSENAKNFCNKYLSWNVITENILHEINLKVGIRNSNKKLFSKFMK